MDDTFYKHARLRDTSKQIRLLKIVSNASDAQKDGLHFKLDIFDFESAPAYRTLSYTWGDDTKQHHIRVDNKLFPVRNNLFNFLRIYHQRSTEGYIWIDYICIDQSDLSERNEQVAMMGDIYKGHDLINMAGAGSIRRSVSVAVA